MKASKARVPLLSIVYPVTSHHLSYIWYNSSKMPTLIRLTTCVNTIVLIRNSYFLNCNDTSILEAYPSYI